MKRNIEKKLNPKISKPQTQPSTDTSAVSINPNRTAFTSPGSPMRTYISPRANSAYISPIRMFLQILLQ